MRYRKKDLEPFAIEIQGKKQEVFHISKGIPFATHHFIRKGLPDYNKYTANSNALYPELLDTV